MRTRYESVRKSGGQHILATTKSTGRAMIFAGLLSGIIAAILVEGFAMIAAGSFTVPLQTHVYAAAFALVCAYAAIVTVLLRGVIATLVDSIEWVADEVQKLTEGVIHQAETVLGVQDGHGPYVSDDVVSSGPPTR